MTILTKIKLNPNLYFEKTNKSYNREVEVVIADIFQTNRIINDDYILVGDYSVDQIRDFTPFTERDSALSTYNNHDKFEEIIPVKNNAKAYENLVAHLMLKGNFDTYVIAGGMGTGKTSACDFIIALLTTKLDSRGNFIINIKFDFNSHFGDTEDEIITTFRQSLYEKLYLKIEDYFRENPNALDRFCDILEDKNKRVEYSEFARFRDYTDVDWMDGALTLDAKINKLLQYIDKYTDNLIPVIKLIHFIAHNYQNNYVILVFDNVDILTPSCQRRILLKVFQYNAIAKIKCFIPLRRATFKRTLREIQKDQYSKAAYTFGYIHHHGVEPLKVVLERVNNFLKNQHNHPLLKSLAPNYQEHIIKRFIVFKYFLETENAFSRFFASISGRSSRVALELARRFFVNNVIEFNSHKINYDMGIKAFMVSENPSLLFNNIEEKEVANILSGNIYDNFSFLPYLIIEYIEKASQLEEFEIKYIYQKVNKSFKGRLSKQSFLDTINYILSVRRPLVWSDDKAYYDTDTNLEDCVNTLQFTEVGKVITT